jgi:hypothetical protein
VLIDAAFKSVKKVAKNHAKKIINKKATKHGVFDFLLLLAKLFGLYFFS